MATSKFCPTCRASIALRGISHGCPVGPILAGVEPVAPHLTNQSATVIAPTTKKAKKLAAKVRVTEARRVEAEAKKRRGSPLMRVPQDLIDRLDAYAAEHGVDRSRALRDVITKGIAHG